MRTVTLTLEIWPWVKVMTHHWVIDNNRVKYYPNPTWQWGVMALHRFSVCKQWPWPWRYDLGSRSWHNLGSLTISMWNIIKIQLCSEEKWPRQGLRYVQRWPWRYDFGSTSWHTRGLWTTIVWNIIQIQLGCEEIQLSSEELWPGQIFSMRALWRWPLRYDLWSRSWHTLGYWTTIVWNIIQIQHGSVEL